MSTDELYYASIDLLKQLIAIPSPSREEKDVADVIEKYLKKNGIYGILFRKKR